MSEQPKEEVPKEEGKPKEECCKKECCKKEFPGFHGFGPWGFPPMFGPPPCHPHKHKERKCECGEVIPKRKEGEPKLKLISVIRLHLGAHGITLLHRVSKIIIIKLFNFYFLKIL